MVKHDTEAVRHIAYTSWHHTYEGIIPRHIQDTFLERAYHPEIIEEKRTHAYLYVAELAGEIIGFANVSIINEAKEAELFAIYLLPTYQGYGAGTALLKHSIQEQGLQTLFVEVEQANDVGMQFYKAKGFTHVKTYTEDFAGHSLQTVQLRLDV